MDGSSTSVTTDEAPERVADAFSTMIGCLESARQYDAPLVDGLTEAVQAAVVADMPPRLRASIALAGLVSPSHVTVVTVPAAKRPAVVDAVHHVVGLHAGGVMHLSAALYVVLEGVEVGTETMTGAEMVAEYARSHNGNLFYQAGFRLGRELSEGVRDELLAASGTVRIFERRCASVVMAAPNLRLAPFPRGFTGEPVAELHPLSMVSVPDEGQSRVALHSNATGTREVLVTEEMAEQIRAALAASA